MRWLTGLGAEQLARARDLLETLVDEPVASLADAPFGDEETSEAEEEAAGRSKEWFKKNPGTLLGRGERTRLSMADLESPRKPA